MSKRRGVMLAMPFEERRLEKWPVPWLVQPKLDGDRCRAIFDSEGCLTLLTSEENLITSVPHIFDALQDMGLRDIELDGELYCHGTPHQEIHGVVGRTVNIHNDFESIQFHIFDYVSDKPQVKRLVELQDNIKESSCIKIVPTEAAVKLEDIMKHLDTFTKLGYEGIIVRHIAYPYVRKRSTGMMKFKPRRSDYYQVTGYEEEISIHGEPKGSLGALWLSDQSGERFKVGSGSLLTRENRIQLWREKDKLVGRFAHIYYQHLTERKVPRFPVLVELLDSGQLGTMNPLFKF